MESVTIQNEQSVGVPGGISIQLVKLGPLGSFLERSERS